MSNLLKLLVLGSTSPKQLALKIVVVILVVCGVANTYIMGLLWYKRGFHLSYCVFGGLCLVIVAIALWHWPEKENKSDLPYIPELVDVRVVSDEEWEKEYQEPEIHVDGEGLIS